MIQNLNFSTPFSSHLTTITAITTTTDTTATTTTTAPVDCDMIDFVVWGCVVMLLCLLGYIGNSLSFMALQRDKRSAATTLLQSLSISDIVLLLSVNLTDSLPYLCHYTLVCPNPWISWPHVRYIWLLTPIAHMTSIWLVVLVAANRYWAVCRPHHMADTWSLKRTWTYVSCVIIASFLFNSPRFFEYQIVDAATPFLNTPQPNNQIVDVATQSFNTSLHFHLTLSNSSNSTNSTPYLILQHQLHSASRPLSPTKNHQLEEHNTTNNNHQLEEQTHLGRSQIYRVGYKVVVVNLLLVLLPLALLLVTSVWIMRELKVLKSRRRQQRGASLLEGSSKKNKHSKEVTVMLVAVVLLAVICQTPLAIFHFLRYAIAYECGSVVYFLELISKLLVNVNSCANFLVYYVLSPRFRRLLTSLIACQPINSATRRDISNNNTIFKSINNATFKSNNNASIKFNNSNETSTKNKSNNDNATVLYNNNTTTPPQ